MRAKKIASILRQSKVAKNRRQIRLLRGKFEALLKGLSYDLQDSALREFQRIAAKLESY